MEYFRLKQSKEVVNPIEVIGSDMKLYTSGMTHQDFKKLEEVKVCYADFTGIREVPDILKKPTYMVSDEIRKVMEMYDENISFKAIQVFPLDERQVKEVSKIYWICDCVMEDCMHQDTTVLPNGELENLTLDRNKVKGREIFRIKGTLINELVVSLPVVESIARRNMYGVEFEKIKIR